jgi:hypothetical protein
MTDWMTDKQKPSDKMFYARYSMLHACVLACSSAMLQLVTSSLSHCPSLSIARERRVIGMLAHIHHNTDLQLVVVCVVCELEFKSLERKARLWHTRNRYVCVSGN